MSELITTFLTNYLPMITILIGFIASGLTIISKMKNILSKSNLDNILENIQAEKDVFHEDFEKLISLTKQLMTENAELKAKNAEILEQLTRISQED